MTDSIDATYSAEDNSLRLYPSCRLDEETFKRVKECGFKWAPKQGLFVAHKWTPNREDLCIELAGEITAEQTTIIERAEAKAARLDELAVKRQAQANSFHDAANRISQRFANGQPILVGHHSERSARKDQERMHSAMDKAVKATNAISYWQYRAEGVERHANRKGNAGVRARRIKKLLAQLRDQQRAINHAQICLKLWNKITEMTDGEEKTKAVHYYAGTSLTTGSAAPYYRGDSLWSMLDKETITIDEAIERCLSFHEYQAQNPYTLRWISHILNRLAFERNELGEVQKYDGELSAVILQAFARQQGAHKPKATRRGDCWALVSTVDLPAHIGDSNSLSLDAESWKDLMQSSGYQVPEPKQRRKSTSTTVPLINPTMEEAQKLQAMWNESACKRGDGTTLGGVKGTEVRPVKQAIFSAYSKGSYSPFNTVEIDINGAKIWSSYKGKSGEPVCRIRTGPSGGSVYSAASIVVIEDKPNKALPIEWVTA